MRMVKITGVALALLMASGCMYRASLAQFQTYADVALCQIVTNQYSLSGEIRAASEILAQRGEDCKDYGGNQSTITIKKR